MEKSDRFERLRQEPFTQIGTLKRQGAQARGRRFFPTVGEIFSKRHILFRLVRRDIKSRYKDSSLGLLWTLIRPLTQLAIYFVVVGKFLGAERGIPNFAIYIFIGLAAFGLFQEIVSNGTASVLSNAGLVKKVYVPRELFPLASVGTALFNFAILFVIVIAILIATQRLIPSPAWWYLLPSLIVILSFGLALAFLLSAWFVYLRDIGYLVEVIMMVMLWASPILYSWEMVRNFAEQIGQTWIIELYSANPATLAVLGFQQALWAPSAGDSVATPENLMLRLIIAAMVGLICVVGAQRVFARLQGNFAQEL